MNEANVIAFAKARGEDLMKRNADDGRNTRIPSSTPSTEGNPNTLNGVGVFSRRPRYLKRKGHLSKPLKARALCANGSAGNGIIQK